MLVPGEDDRFGDVPARIAALAASTGGVAFTSRVGEDTPAWATSLLATYAEHAKTAKVCPHLHADPTQGATWLALAPALRSCNRPACEHEIVRSIEHRLGHTLAEEPARCTACDGPGPVTGVSVQAGSTLLRGMVCAECLTGLIPPDTQPSSAATGNPEPSDISSDSEADDERKPMDLQDEPIVLVPQTLSRSTNRRDFDELGWRAISRGGLMAEACCDATIGPLTPDQAVVGGLMVRAHKLARGLFDATRMTDTVLHGLAFRSLIETTITLEWFVRKDTERAFTQFRAAGFAPWRSAAAIHANDADASDAHLSRLIARRFDQQLAASGLTWEDVPQRADAWGGGGSETA